MNIVKLEQFLTDNQEPNYRLKQILKNYFSGKYKSFSEMTDLPLNLRQLLIDNVSLYSVSAVTIQKDKFSQKVLLKLDDGLHIESVLMEYQDWLTVCVSTQVGCPLGCKFCATGKMGFIRNLRSDEMIDQVIFWNNQLYPQNISRVVFMGMGEPFLNWDNLLESIKTINSKAGLNIGSRKISISTAGIVPRIVDFANLNTEINLAISLHSADQKIRESIMPIAKQYSLKELVKSLDYYVSKTKRQVIFEYALIKDINDTPRHLKLLVDFIKHHHLFFLNIIPLNPIKNGLIPSPKTNFDYFIRGLNLNHVQYSIRRSLGNTINSACGQLIAE